MKVEVLEKNQDESFKLLIDDEFIYEEKGWDNYNDAIRHFREIDEFCDHDEKCCDMCDAIKIR